jgi:hypothetical protein
MLTQGNINWQYVKTYATEKALMKRIEQDKDLYPDYDDRFYIMRTPEGRWTAIVKLDLTKGGYIGRYEFVKF